MAKTKTRYLVAKPGRKLAAGGRETRWFWQPSTELQKQGWRVSRLHHADGTPITSRADAARAAAVRGRELDAWRNGDGGAGHRRSAGCIDTLIHDYKQWGGYQRLKPKTRKSYDWFLAIISDWIGDLPVAAVNASMIDKFYRNMQAVTPAKANGLIRVLQLLLRSSHIIYKPGQPGYIEFNPAEKLRLVTIRKPGVIWPHDAVTLFAEAADRMGHYSIATAVILNEWLGQREGDIIGMPRSAYHRGTLTVTQAKTGAVVALPIDMVAAVKIRLEEEFRRQEARGVAVNAGATEDGGPLLICETTGLAWKEDHFRRVFARIRARAAAKWPAWILDHRPASPVATTDLFFMHLRHTAVTRLAEAGVDIAGIAGVTGHTIGSIGTIIERYLIRTGKIARQAFRKRLDQEGI